MEEIEQTVGRLQEITERMREPDLDREELLALAQECVDLAGRAGAELDRRARAVAQGDSPTQPR